MTYQFKSVTANEYDIDIVATYYSLELLLKKHSTIHDGRNKLDYLQVIKDSFSYYCTVNDFDFEAHYEIKLPIVITYQSTIFISSLGLFLIVFDRNKIWNVLDFQLGKYTGEDDFVKTVEHQVYKFIKTNQPIVDDALLQSINNWVLHKRNNLPVQIEKPQSVSSKKTPRLYWVGRKGVDKDMQLKEFSKKLYSKQYTNKPTDFEKIFTEHKQIGWQKTIEELAYLFWFLNKEGIIKSSPNRGFLKLVRHYFDDYCTLVVNKNGLKDIIYQMNTKQPLRHENVKKSIEKLVENI